MNSKKHFLAVLVILSFVVLISGCTQQAPGTGSGQGNTTPPTEQGAIHEVVIKNFAFDPAEITIKKGDTVKWTNEDSAPHFVASNPHPTHTDLPALSSGTLSTGQSFSLAFTKTGTFGYHCHLHPSMTGTVIVEE